MEPASNQQPTQMAWQPLTFPGVARFSGASFTRLGVVLLVAAVLSVMVMTWFANRAYLPVFDEAVTRVTEPAGFLEGRLEWPGSVDTTLANNSRFAILVVRNEVSTASQLADFQLELLPNEFRVRSLLGYVRWAYPVHWQFPLDRLDLEPWWQARRPCVVAGIMAITGLGLLLTWASLGALMAGPIRLWGWVIHRQISWSSSWRLAMAALMPGALWLNAVIIGYALNGIGLVVFLILFALHLVIDVFYLVWSPLFLPSIDSLAGPGNNPFSSGPERLSAESNPFRPL